MMCCQARWCADHTVVAQIVSLSRDDVGVDVCVYVRLSVPSALSAPSVFQKQGIGVRG